MVRRMMMSESRRNRRKNDRKKHQPKSDIPKKDKKFNFCEAYAKTAVDKIGAGDAMLSIIALCLKCRFDRDLALLTGSLAAAQSVETIGNKEAVNKIKILKALENIFK